MTAEIAYIAAVVVGLCIAPAAHAILDWIQEREDNARAARHVAEAVAEEKRRASDAGYPDRETWLAARQARNTPKGQGSGRPFTSRCDCPACHLHDLHHIRPPEHDDYDHAKQLVQIGGVFFHPDTIWNEYDYALIRTCTRCGHLWGQN